VMERQRQDKAGGGGGGGGVGGGRVVPGDPLGVYGGGGGMCSSTHPESSCVTVHFWPIHIRRLR